METLKRLDIAAHRNVLMLVVESDLLPPDPAIVVIPLLPDYPAVALLNPTIRHGERDIVLATRLFTAVRRSTLRPAGDARRDADRITRAIDILMAGV
ncbi:CcdB family protein [Loktanella fryxellensis]|uniref:CcdB family protein n=1 Tax=Loktanella fryxellensis TaxID=245187 RepID=UPI001C435989|nr:CcdB family protein [Loktanella fryxellensis]